MRDLNRDDGGQYCKYCDQEIEWRNDDYSRMRFPYEPGSYLTRHKCPQSQKALKEKKEKEEAEHKRAKANYQRPGYL